jgi:hypothetical protein
MPFQRIDLLPRYDPKSASRSRNRWETAEGRIIGERVLELIRKGGGEDFLQWDFENGRLGLLESQWDLAGFDLTSETIFFPEGDSFEAMDFSYARFWHCSLQTPAFPPPALPSRSSITLSLWIAYLLWLISMEPN